MRIPAIYQNDLRMRLRFRARQSILDLRYLAAVRNGALDRFLQMPRVQILYTHDVPDACLPNMRALFRRLARDHTFVTYDEAVARINAGRIDRPFIAVALDDGFAVSAGLLALFDEFGIRSCFFVIGDALDFGDDPVKSAQLCREKLAMPPRRFLNWAAIDNLRARGHEVGAHTLSHPDLTAISREHKLKSPRAMTYWCGGWDRASTWHGPMVARRRSSPSSRHRSASRAWRRGSAGIISVLGMYIRCDAMRGSPKSHRATY